MKRRKSGFTILEMVVVLLVISVIMLLTLPNIQQKREIINRKGCKAQLEVINSQILLYQIDHDTDYVSMDDLVAEGYISASQRSCPGGKEIFIINGEAVSE